MAKFTVELTVSAREELRAMRPFDRQAVLERIRQVLTSQPDVETKNCKKLPGLKVPWDQVGDTRELKVDEFRVFFEIETATNNVVVKAIRHKPPHLTTEDIL